MWSQLISFEDTCCCCRPQIGDKFENGGKRNGVWMQQLNKTSTYKSSSRPSETSTSAGRGQRRTLAQESFQRTVKEHCVQHGGTMLRRQWWPWLSQRDLFFTMPDSNGHGNLWHHCPPPTITRQQYALVIMTTKSTLLIPTCLQGAALLLVENHEPWVWE